MALSSSALASSGTGGTDRVD
ncbi:MAG: hypothetical protein QOE59_4392, partial [Actinomycetota bacterium]|nr:hypothetical protein [Actinomycetota bacterium]